VTAPALELKGVERSFNRGRSTVTAVRGIDLLIPRGSVTGVLGPNGAGKTTTIKMAATLLEPSAGDVFVDGVDAVREPRTARGRLGLVLGGDRGFYMRASAQENLRFFATLAGVPGRRANARTREVLEIVGLVGRERDRVETYSRGMKQRLHIARALLGDPALMLLDEPSIGLDPEGARDLRRLVRQLRESGCGILLTTHHLDEADDLSDDLVVVNSGRVVAQGSAQDIAALGGVDTVVSFLVTTFSAVEERALRTDPRVAEVLVRSNGNQQQVDLVGRGMEDGTGILRSIGITPEWTTIRPVTLEEAYLAFVARDAR